MTGTGSAQFSDAKQSFLVELRSTNGRFFDIQLHIPEYLQHLEANIREHTQKVLQRGTIELKILHRSQQQSIEIQKDLIQSLQTTLKDNDVAMQVQVRDLHELGCIFVQETITDADEQLCMDLVAQAVSNCLEYQLQEGKVIYTNICELIERFTQLVDGLRHHAGKINTSIEERLEQRIAALQHLAIDEKNIQSVLANLLIKASITEELDRLQGSIEQFFKTIEDSNGYKGKKLEFICQEFVRETNTIGTKLPFLSENNTIVEMKCVIEDIREHLRNIV